MPYTVTPLLVGVRDTDQGIMTYQRHYGKHIWLPLWAFLLRGEGLNVLVDTGLDDFIVPEAFTAETGLEPLYMDEALAAHGLEPDDVHAVVNTHLHDDHCANNLMFEKARFFVQRVEYEFCMNPHPLDHRYEPDFIEGIEFELLDGDAEPLPGIRCLAAPGHSPGVQAVLFDTASGPAVITGFCCNKENFPPGAPAVCPGVHSDAFTAWDSAQRIARLGARIIPMHELEVAKLNL